MQEILEEALEKNARETRNRFSVKIEEKNPIIK